LSSCCEYKSCGATVGAPKLAGDRHRHDTLAEQTLQRDVDLVDRNAGDRGEPPRVGAEPGARQRGEHRRFVFDRAVLLDGRGAQAQPRPSARTLRAVAAPAAEDLRQRRMIEGEARAKARNE
jgi:hypothetical protein